MSIKLERGANLSLTKLTPKANNFFIELNWSNNQQANETFDIVRTIIVKETNGQITNDEVKKAIETEILKI